MGTNDTSDHIMHDVSLKEGSQFVQYACKYECTEGNEFITVRNVSFTQLLPTNLLCLNFSSSNTGMLSFFLLFRRLARLPLMSVTLELAELPALPGLFDCDP